MLPALEHAGRDPELIGLPLSVYVCALFTLDFQEFRTLPVREITTDLRSNMHAVDVALRLLWARGYFERCTTADGPAYRIVWATGAPSRLFAGSRATEPEPLRRRDSSFRATYLAQRFPDEAPHCECCGYMPPDERILNVHHVVPFARGGADGPENGVALCPTCHAEAHMLGTNSARREWDGPRTRDELLAALRARRGA